MHQDKTSNTKRNSFLLALTAFIWGTAFVAQSRGGDSVGPYTFNCIRSLIGSCFLIVIISILDKIGLTKKPVDKKSQKTLLIGGICCGFALCIASNLQQMGIYYGSSVGKAGFLTACYIIIVPILGLFFKKKCSLNVWIGVAVTVIGLYLLCIDGKFIIQLSDILLMLCAFFFAIHILVIDHFSPLVDGMRMSCIQFFVCGVLTFIPTFIFDMDHNISGIKQWATGFSSFDAWIPILYAGVFSCGIAYTLQIIGQKGINPTIASLIMSLESVFSVLAGWIILKETLSIKELIGCALIFIAVILAQLPTKEKPRA